MIINGEFSSSLSALDRGLQYGDGLFETIAVKQGQACLFSRHLDRLQLSCQKLKIQFPGRELLTAEVDQAVVDQDTGVLKVIVTRGPSARGYKLPVDASPTRILSTQPWPDYPSHYTDEGVSVCICSTRLGMNPGLAGLKHLNRLEQVTARSEWDDTSIAEGLMLNQQNELIEGTMSNLFLVKNKKLITPALDQSGIAGIMRALIIERAKVLDIAISIRAVMLDDLDKADAVFLSNSLIGIWPVRAIEDRTYDIELIPENLIQQVRQLQYQP